MRAISVLALLLIPTLSQAAEYTVGAYGGGLWTDNLEVLKSTWVVTPRFTYHYDDNVGIEGEIGFMKGVTRVGAFSYTGLTPRINLVGNLAPESPIQPMLVVGPGMFYKSTQDAEPLGVDYVNPDVDFLVNGGPAVQVPIGDKIVLRSDYRILVNLGTESYRNRGDAFSNWEWTLGVGVNFGGAPDADKDGIADDVDACIDSPEDIDQFEDEDGCPDTDNDGDGILDDADTCRDEKEDMDGFADEDGCPDTDNDEDGLLDADDTCPDAAGAKELGGCPDKDEDGVADIEDVCPDAKGDAELGGCPDKDGDGLADVDDECPDQEGPETAEGCPDKDGDRVPDAKDACPDEPADPRINPRRSDGCLHTAFWAQGALIITEKVQFSSGKAVISKRSYKLLDEVAAAFVKAKRVKKVQVEGHTDSDGSADANLKLSQERAEAVVAYLVGKGVAEGRLVAHGFGATKPVKPNDTKEGKAANRRVEFNILEDDVAPRKRKGKRKGGKKKGGAKAAPANPCGGAKAAPANPCGGAKAAPANPCDAKAPANPCAGK